MLATTWSYRPLDIGRYAFDRTLGGVAVCVECWTGGGFTHGHAIVRVAGRVFAIHKAGQA